VAWPFTVLSRGDRYAARDRRGHSRFHREVTATRPGTGVAIHGSIDRRPLRGQGPAWPFAVLSRGDRYAARDRRGHSRFYREVTATRPGTGVAIHGSIER